MVNFNTLHGTAANADQKTTTQNASNVRMRRSHFDATTINRSEGAVSSVEDLMGDRYSRYGRIEDRSRERSHRLKKYLHKSSCWQAEIPGRVHDEEPEYKSDDNVVAIKMK